MATDRYPRTFHTDEPVALARELGQLVDALRARDRVAEERFVPVPLLESGLRELGVGEVMPVRGDVAAQVRLPPARASLGRSLGVLLYGGAVAVEVFAATDDFVEGVDILTMTPGVPGLTTWLATETGWWAR